MIPGHAPQTPPRKDPAPHVKGWEPGIRFNGTEGEIVTRPTDEKNPDWAEQLEAWGFDPSLYEVIEPIQVRTWDAWFGGEQRQMWYYRAQIRTRQASAGQVDLSDLEDRIRAAKRGPRLEGESAFLLGFADWQAGKRDGDGVDGLIARVTSSIEEAKTRVTDLRSSGRDIGTLVLAGLGDLFENCSGHYAMQAFQTVLDRREQTRLVRRLILEAIVELAPLFSRVVVIAVPGNHGENRLNGKAYTSFGDNDDVAVFEQIHDALKFNGDTFDHVSFVIPNNDLAQTLDIGGTIVGFAHGHQARGGGTPQQKIERWWKGQQHGRQPVGDADILITAHYHHLIVSQQGCRTHIQAPALDGGSDWYTASTGQESYPGTLSMTIGKNVGPGGWNDLSLLGSLRLEQAS